ncbi:MAG: sulfite exporter TauE/SafE family protein [Eggerthellaceae bacterium]|nr:sulfite exporter TauE/SafE family protein [Eggerthellaceae bacterium]
MELVGMAAASIVVGLVVGVLSGMLGIGGGTILVPVFKLAYLMEPIACTATSLFTIIPTSVSGVVSHVRGKTCIPKLGIAAGIGGAITSPVGVWLATKSADWMIMAAAAVIIAYSSFTMFRKALKAPKTPKAAKSSAARENAREAVSAAAEKNVSRETFSRSEKDARSDVSRETFAAPCGGSASATPAVASAPSDATSTHASIVTACNDSSAAAPAVPPVPALTRKQLAMGTGIGLVAGLASGYVGVGGGFLMVPMMLQLIHTPMKLTSGTSLVAVMILAIPGVVMQAMLGNVNWVAGIAVACGSIPGATIGAHLVSRIPERTLRFIFSGFLLVAAAALIANQLA